MRYISLCLLVICLTVGCKSASDPILGSPTPEEIASGIQVLDVPSFDKGVSRSNVQLVDVRTFQEYNSGHIENAINIDFQEEDFSDEIQKIDKDRPVFIYCRSGGRSGRA